MAKLVRRNFLIVTLSITAIVVSLLVMLEWGLASRETVAHAESVSATGFRTVRRPYAVDVEAEYNLDGLTIPREEIHTLVRKDGIPALTDPNLEPVAEATWLASDARIIEAVVGKEVLGVPLQVLDYHEIVNTTLGDEPVAITYCPLCDSATVFLRRVIPAGTGGTRAEVLEFGVSGALYNSNVLLYDRTHKGLWSQLGMVAVSGPLVGSKLDMLPVRIVTFSEFKSRHPQGHLVSRETGHRRPYEGAAYANYFSHDQLMVPVAEMGDALKKRKTLGVGIALDDSAWFIPIDAIGNMGYTVDTPKGKAHVTKTDAGIVVEELPVGAASAQSFYYSWSAFYPHTLVLR